MALQEQEMVFKEGKGRMGKKYNSEFTYTREGIIQKGRIWVNLSNVSAKEFAAVEQQVLEVLEKNGIKQW